MKIYSIVCSISFFSFCLLNSQVQDLPVDDEQNIHWRSFMFTRPIYRNIAAQQSLWHDLIFNAPCKESSNSFQIIPMWQQSIERDKLSKYFFFKGHKQLIIKGDNVIMGNPHLRDVRAEWVNLPHDFSGVMTLAPQQRQFGIWIEAKKDLRSLCSWDLISSWWFSVAIPFQIVENNINIGQKDVQNPSSTSPTDIIQAFNQPNWRYAKFNGKQKTHSFAEMMFKLGTRFLDRDGFQIGAYSGLLVPLHTHQNPEFIFSPFIGNNGHAGFLTGATFQLPLNCDVSEYMAAFFVNIENIYFFRNNQRRTFDLHLKPWTRYLLFNKNDGTANIPGVNVLTFKVRARPYNMVDLSVGMRWQAGCFELELGYDLWAHGNEKIKLRHRFPEDTFGIAGDGALVPGTNISATASASDIAEQSPNDIDPITHNPIFVPITVRDLDFFSPATRSAVNNRFHIAMGCAHITECRDILFGGGAFVEVPQMNTSLETWGVWIKFGASL